MSSISLVTPNPRALDSLSAGQLTHWLDSQPSDATDQECPMIDVSTGEGAVVAEALALLEGTAGERLLAPGLRLPAWAWVNALAHRPPGQLHAILDMAVGPADDRWEIAVSHIADRLASLSPPRATEVQARVLLPWELATLTPGEASPDPDDLVSVVDRYLRR
jgi:hypothetical protein